MPRIRSIKPEFWSSPSVTSMSPWARLLYIAMWNWADDAGRGTYNPRELLGFVFPNDEEISVAEFRRICAEVRRACAVDFYDVGGRHYYAIPNWKRHQSKNARMSVSKYPAPEDGLPFDPEKMQVIGEDAESSGISAHMRGSSAHSRGSSARMRGISSTGTGEQGNRVEGVKEISNGTSYPQAVDKTTPPENSPDQPPTPNGGRPVCKKHAALPDDEIPPCGACERLRKAAEARARDEEATQRALRRAAIDACRRCDDNGIAREGSVAVRCTHETNQPPF